MGDDIHELLTCYTLVLLIVHANTKAVQVGRCYSIDFPSCRENTRPLGGLSRSSLGKQGSSTLTS